MSPSRARNAENWKKMRPFLLKLEQTHSGPLAFKLAVSEKFVGWDGKPPGPKEPPRTASRWMRTVPGMRELWRTGWIHNRVRMVVASFPVKDLLLP